MNCLLVPFDLEIHDQLARIHIHKLGTDADFWAGQDIGGVEFMHQRAGIFEEIPEQIFTGLLKGNATELIIEQEHTQVPHEDGEDFAVHTLEDTVVLTSQGGNGRWAYVDIVVDTSCEVDAKEWVFDIGNRVDGAANPVRSRFTQYPVDSFEG